VCTEKELAATRVINAIVSVLQSTECMPTKGTHDKSTPLPASSSCLLRQALGVGGGPCFLSNGVRTVGAPVENIIDIPRLLAPGVIADHSIGSSSSSAPIPASCSSRTRAFAAGLPAILAISSAVTPAGNSRPFSQYVAADWSVASAPFDSKASTWRL
jgi:hypothetical protein